MKHSGIYSIKHIRTGREYIGGSRDIRARFSQHRSKARRNPAGSPMHELMASDGFDAFEWRLVILCPLEDLRNLERQFILERMTVVPYGFNRGSENGAVSLTMRGAMDEPSRRFYEAATKQASERGLARLEALRADPAFDAEFHQANSAGASKREANIKARRAVDPAFDDRIRETRRRAMSARRDCNVEQARATFRERMKDPEYAARISEQRRRAAIISNEKRRKRNASVS